MDFEKRKKEIIDKVDILIDLDRYDQALEYCYGNLHLFENDYKIYESLARIYLVKSELDKMQEFCEKALALSPETNFLNFLLGVCYYWKGEYSKSEEQINSALHIDPNYHRCHFYMARIRFAQKRNYEALERIDLALNFFPQSAEYLQLKRKILLALNYNDEANRLIDSIIEISPNEIDVLNEKAALLIENGKLNKAEFILNNTLKLSPEKTKTKNLLFKAHEEKYTNLIGISFLVYAIVSLYLIREAFRGFELTRGIATIIYCVFYFFILYSTLMEIQAIAFFRKNKFLAIELKQFHHRRASVIIPLTSLIYLSHIVYLFSNNTFFFSIPFTFVFIGVMFFIQQNKEAYIWRSLFVLLGVAIAFYTDLKDNIFNFLLIGYSILGLGVFLYEIPDYE